MKDVEIIKPSLVSGSITAPSSKSMMQRAVAAAYLSKSEPRILNPSYSDDAMASIRLVDGLKRGDSVLNCGESGLCLRMFSPIVALLSREIRLEASGSLNKRPADMITDALTKLSVNCTTNSGFPPISIKGPIRPSDIELDASLTSQLLTGLLMALPLCEGDSSILVNKLKSKPYVEMTLALLSDFGIYIENQDFKLFKIKGGQEYKARKYCVEGDWSGAAFFLVAGAIAGKSGKLVIKNLNYKDSLQADKRIVDALKLSGAGLEISSSKITVFHKSREPFEFDVSDCPDLFPPLAVLAASCKGKSVIKGASRLIHKESNRALSIKEEFHKMGITVSLDGDLIEIVGKKAMGASVYSHGDHRIAMALSILAISSDKETTLKGANCVSKSYPRFFDDLSAVMV